MKSISTISTNSDKISHHGYHRSYDRYLNSLLGISNIHMLELGYENGYSIELWKKYFNEVKIHSIDIIEDPANPLIDRYFKVDQDSEEQLDKFVRENKTSYHFIIDDASHVPNHQWNTFIRFINILEDGGIYIIEDIETSFWKESEIYGYRFNADEDTLLKKIAPIFQTINNEFISDEDLHMLKLTELEAAALRQIESVTIAYNSLIFVKKDHKYSNFYRANRDYRHKSNINSNKSAEKTPFWKRIFK